MAGKLVVVISVVMPVLDGLPWLVDQLEALGAQQCDEPWEVVVADNGSTDASIEAVRRFSERFGRVRIVDASQRPGQAAARNIGAKAATGELLAFCDADDLVGPRWLGALARALASAEVVAGVFDMSSLNGGAPRAPSPAATEQLGFLPFGLSSNLAVRRSVFESVGGFSEELRVGEDADLCWRLQLEGCTFAVESEAVVAKRERIDSKRIFLRAVEYGRSGAVLYKRYRRAGAHRELARWARSVGWIAASVFRLGDSDVRRQWMHAVGLRVGRVIGSAEQRVFFP